MKVFGLILAVCILALALLLGSVKFTATLKSDAFVYQSAENKPLNERAPLSAISTGGRVEVLECIDIKSDQYLRVLTREGDVGYLYNLDIVPSVSLALQPRIEFSDAFGCAFFLLARLD